MKYYALILLACFAFGCDSISVPSATVQNRRLIPKARSASVVNGDFTVVILQISESYPVSDDGPFVTIDFAVDYDGTEHADKWNETSFLYVDRDGNTIAPTGSSMRSLFEHIPISAYRPFPLLDAQTIGFSSDARINRQTQPGLIPPETTAILVEFGLNEKCLPFTIPISWQ
jgi:hypothetical protein